MRERIREETLKGMSLDHRQPFEETLRAPTTPPTTQRTRSPMSKRLDQQPSAVEPEVPSPLLRYNSDEDCMEVYTI